MARGVLESLGESWDYPLRKSSVYDRTHALTHPHTDTRTRMHNTDSHLGATLQLTKSPWSTWLWKPGESPCSHWENEPTQHKKDPIVEANSELSCHEAPVLPTASTYKKILIASGKRSDLLKKVHLRLKSCFKLLRRLGSTEHHKWKVTLRELITALINLIILSCSVFLHRLG